VWLDIGPYKDETGWPASGSLDVTSLDVEILDGREIHYGSCLLVRSTPIVSMNGSDRTASCRFSTSQQGNGSSLCALRGCLARRALDRPAVFRQREDTNDFADLARVSRYGPEWTGTHTPRSMSRN
jgi:hypothetical protein